MHIERNDFVEVRDPNNDNTPLSLRGVLTVLFRHKWKMMFTFISIVGSVGYIVFSLPESYVSQAKILIKPGRETISPDQMGSGRGNEVMKSELAILQSEVLVKRVVDELLADYVLGRVNSINQQVDWSTTSSLVGTGTNPLDKSDQTASVHDPNAPAQVAVSDELKSTAVASILSGLKTSLSGNIVSVAFTSHDSTVASNVLGKLLELFFQRRIEVHAPQATSALFEQEANKTLANIEINKKELQELRKSYNVGCFIEGKQTCFVKLADLKSDISETYTAIDSIKAKMGFIENKMKDHSSFILPQDKEPSTPFSQELKTRLFDLKLKEMDLAARYTDNDRNLMIVREQKREIEGALSAELGSAKTEVVVDDPVFNDLKSQLGSQEAEVLAKNAILYNLQKELEKIQSDADQLTEHEGEEAAIKREIANLEESYAIYRRKLQQAQMSAALDMEQVSNVSIIQPATINPSPVTPIVRRYLLFGLFLGFVGSIAVAYVMEYINDTLKSSEDVKKKLGLPLLVTISDKEYQKCT